jgi:hypothetical protein
MANLYAGKKRPRGTACAQPAASHKLSPHSPVRANKLARTTENVNLSLAIMLMRRTESKPKTRSLNEVFA